jgi:hypothetical protein
MSPANASDGIENACDESMTGCAFLVEERRPKESLEICEKYTSEGAKLLIISRDPPQQLLSGSPLVPAKIIWLTNLTGKDRMNPTAVGVMMGEIKKFVEQSKNRAVVLIDGFEYLISLNTFNLMLQFANQLRDMFVTSGAILIIPIDIRTLDQREQALLERDFQIVSSAVTLSDGAGAVHFIQMSASENLRT